MTHKRFEIIVNPIAGAGLAAALADRLARHLHRRGHQAAVYRTTGPGDATEYARGVTADRADAILVAGGDGTISEVIDGLAALPGADDRASQATRNEARVASDAAKHADTSAGPRLAAGLVPRAPLREPCPPAPLREVCPAPDNDPPAPCVLPHPPLAVLPVGTENLLGKVLGARANVGVAEATLLGGRLHRLDVGRVGRPPDRGDRWDAGSGPSAPGRFIMVAGAGFDAEVVHRLARLRTGNITYADYLAPLLKTFLHYGFAALHVEADGEVVCDEPALAFVGNIPRYAMGLPIFRRARYDDGLLDLVVFRCSHRRQLLLHSLRTLLGRHLDHPQVTCRKVRRAVIRSDQAVPLEIDGDDAGQVPVAFEMTGEQVGLLAPPG